METNQTTLADDRTDEETTDTTGNSTTEQKRTSPSRASDGILAPPDQRGGQGCCPWCLASTETFEYREGKDRPRYGNCDAAIPTGTEWYERGEKIIV